MDNNYVTKFEGRVNGQTFTDRPAMEAYIGKLICEGTPITEMSFNNIIRSADKPQQNQGGFPVQGHPATLPQVPGLFVKLIEDRKPNWIKTTFDNYVVPFIDENTFIQDSREHKIGIENMTNDTEKKLKTRMDLFVQLVVSAMKNKQIVKPEAKDYLLNLRDRLAAKAQWCDARAQYYETLIDASKGNDNLVNLWACQEGSKVYGLTGGYCHAFVDIISEHVKELGE